MRDAAAVHKLLAKARDPRSEEVGSGWRGGLEDGSEDWRQGGRLLSIGDEGPLTLVGTKETTC